MKIPTEPQATPVKAVVATPVVQEKPKEPTHKSELISSNWQIDPDGNGIIASNNVTGRVFKGTIAEFNQLLRG